SALLLVLRASSFLPIDPLSSALGLQALLLPRREFVGMLVQPDLRRRRERQLALVHGDGVGLGRLCLFLADRLHGLARFLALTQRRAHALLLTRPSRFCLLPCFLGGKCRAIHHAARDFPCAQS